MVLVDCFEIKIAPWISKQWNYHSIHWLRKSTVGMIVLTNLQQKTWAKGSILWENSKPFWEVDTKGLKGTSRLKGKNISICLYIYACICACIYPPWDGTANLCEATTNLDKVATTLWESTTSLWESGVPSMPLWDPWMPLRSFYSSFLCEIPASLWWAKDGL